MNIQNAIIPAVTAPAWLDSVHCDLAITVPLYAAGVYLADFEAIVTIYRDGDDWAIGDMQVEGWKLNEHAAYDTRCAPIKDANGKPVTVREMVRQDPDGRTTTLPGFIADQIIRELDTRYHMQRAEEALIAAEREWRS